MDTKPPYLRATSPKQALISYHSEQIASCRTFFDDLMKQELAKAERCGVTAEGLKKLVPTIERKWADAVWGQTDYMVPIFRDRLAFHEASLEYLING